MFFQLIILLAVINCLLIFVLPYETLGKQLTEVEDDATAPNSDDEVVAIRTDTNEGYGTVSRQPVSG